MKTVPLLPYRNDRNSIRIARKIKIKNRQRESSFDMNVSLAREESKAGFIDSFFFHFLVSGRNRSGCVGMSCNETLKDSVQENNGLVDICFSCDHIWNSACFVRQHESETSQGLNDFSDFFRNFWPLLEIIEPIKRGKNGSKSQN